MVAARCIVHGNYDGVFFGLDAPWIIHGCHQKRPEEPKGSSTYFFSSSLSFKPSCIF